MYHMTFWNLNFSLILGGGVGLHNMQDTKFVCVNGWPRLGLGYSLHVYNFQLQNQQIFMCSM